MCGSGKGTDNTSIKTHTPEHRGSVEDGWERAQGRQDGSRGFRGEDGWKRGCLWKDNKRDCEIRTSRMRMCVNMR